MEEPATEVLSDEEKKETSIDGNHSESRHSNKMLDLADLGLDDDFQFNQDHLNQIPSE